MKNMGKKIRYIAFFIGVCVLLAGCGKKFDASGYTKAVLDVSYKNEIQKYVELTGADEKEADKIFEDNLQNNMDIMLQEFSGYELPDELEEKYRKLFSDMMKQVKYTVAEAKEVENKNFTVDVKVEPMLIFNDTYQELQKQTEDYATQVFVILHKRKTPRFHVLYNESAKTNICNIYERRCLSQILYIIPHSYTTSLKN